MKFSTFHQLLFTRKDTFLFLIFHSTILFDFRCHCPLSSFVISFSFFCFYFSVWKYRQTELSWQISTWHSYRQQWSLYNADVINHACKHVRRRGRVLYLYAHTLYEKQRTSKRSSYSMGKPQRSLDCFKYVGILPSRGRSIKCRTSFNLYKRKLVETGKKLTWPRPLVDSGTGLNYLWRLKS